MQFSETQIKVAIAVVVLLVVGGAYLLWSRSNVPEPTPMEGQSVLNPMGTAPPSGAPAPSAAPAVQVPGGMSVPRPGTSDQFGMGPSSSAPIPGAR